MNLLIVTKKARPFESRQGKNIADVTFYINCDLFKNYCNRAENFATANLKKWSKNVFA